MVKKAKVEAMGHKPRRVLTERTVQALLMCRRMHMSWKSDVEVKGLDYGS